MPVNPPTRFFFKVGFDFIGSLRIISFIFSEVGSWTARDVIYTLQNCWEAIEAGVTDNASYVQGRYYKHYFVCCSVCNRVKTVQVFPFTEWAGTADYPHSYRAVARMFIVCFQRHFTLNTTVSKTLCETLVPEFVPA